MKFFCDNCGKKYLIPDEMVKGKVLKVRCKVCSHVIEVREGASTEATKQAPQAAAQIGWFYALGGKTHGPFPLGELRAKFSNQEVGEDAYVWNETFTEWLPATSCDEFKGYFQGTALRPPRPTTSLRAIDIESALSPQPAPGPSNPVRPSLKARPVQQQRAAASPMAGLKSSTPASSPLRDEASPTPSPKRKPIPRPAASKPAPKPKPSGSVDFKERLRKLREKANQDLQPAKPASPKPVLAVSKSPKVEKTPVQVQQPADHRSSPLSGLGALDAPTPVSNPSPRRAVETPEIDPLFPGLEKEKKPDLVDPPTEEVPRGDLSDLFPPEGPSGNLAPSSPLEHPTDEAPPETQAKTPVDPEPAPEVLPVEEPPAIADSSAEKEEEKSYTLFPPAEEPKPFFPPPEDSPSAHLQESSFSPDLSNDPAAAFDDKPTPSLLIQLNEIEQNQKKSQRAAIFIAIGVLMVLIVGMSVWALFFADKKSSNAESIINASNASRTEQKKKDRFADFENIKGYDREQLKNLKMVDLDEGEDAIDLKADSEEPTPPDHDGDAKPTKTPARAAKTPKNPAKTGAIAKKSGAPAAEAKASKKGSIFGTKIDLKGSGSALDKGLSSSKETKKETVRGLASTARTENVGKAEKIAVKTDPKKLKAGNPDAVYNKFFEGARRDRVDVEKRNTPSGAPTGGALPTGLTRAQLVAGFKSVRRSATQCLERHTKRSGDRLPTSKVKITVTINGSGKVGALAMSGGVSNTVFGTCMTSKRGAWRFPAFQGPPIQVARTFILQ